MASFVYSNEEYWQQVIDYTLYLNDSSRRAFMLNGRCFGDHRRTNIYVPLGTKQYTGESRELSFFAPMMMQWAYENAVFMKWSLIDESIPLRGDKVVFGIYDGCRRTNAIALLLIKYHPALPEFREAMLHEYDSYMRQLCVEAIGIMGERGAAYAKDIRDSILKFHDDAHYCGEAVKSLARLDDKSAVPLLLDLFEETRDRLDSLSFKEGARDSGSLLLIHEIVSALIKLDPVAAREVLAMALVDDNPHVCHFAKRAFELSPERSYLSLMDESFSVSIGFLPSNPAWSLRKRQKLY